MRERTYVAIDLKSFYASVECRERGLDPLDTHLVVADASRTDKTICLAVTPSLKHYGISGRGRLFEVKAQVREANRGRLHDAPNHHLTGTSTSLSALREDPSLAIDFIIAPPRMALYMAYSTEIYKIYTKYVAPEDILVYSIDEVFIDLTNYLKTYDKSPHDLTMTILRDVLAATGITATAGIGTNLYLAKVAMDIVAKHMPPDPQGVRIAALDEMSYRRRLWTHEPLTDFWRIGRGYAKKLEEHGMFTMGDIARRSLTDEDLFYRLFGKNAELLLDHAWGWEPCTIKDVADYTPESKSMGSGQVLHRPYEAKEARLVLTEMADQLSLDLVDKGLVTNQLVISLSYDVKNITDPARKQYVTGGLSRDGYGRLRPKRGRATINLPTYTSSTRALMDAAAKGFDDLVNPHLLLRKLSIVATRLLPEAEAPSPIPEREQMDLFTDYAALDEKRRRDEEERQRERRIQEAILAMKKKFGKNAVLRGMNLEEAATGRARNAQIGGHKA